MFDIPPQANQIVTVERSTISERAINYSTYNNTFRPKSLNYDSDHIWRKLQELGVADWLLDLKQDKEIQERIAADIYYFAEAKKYTNSEVNKLIQYIKNLVTDEKDIDFSILKNLAQNRNGSIFKRSTFLELPFIFPDYEAAYEAVSPVSRGYLYPQGFAHDSENNTYINYAATRSRMVLVKYDQQGVYQGYILVVSGSPENIVVKKEEDVLKLYTKTNTHVLAWADITSLQWKGETVKTTEIPSVQSVHLQIHYDNGMWLVEQRYADLGQSVSRTKYRTYDDNFNQTGEIYISKSIVGFQLPSSPMYPYIPKIQGIALKDGRIFVGTGGSYIPSSDGKVSPPVSAIGLAELSLDGSLINYGAIRASDYLKYKKENGTPYAIRTETEGLSKLSDGTLTQLVILSNRQVNSINKSSGIVIEKLLDPNGTDYSQYSQPYAPLDLTRYTGNFPRGEDGSIRNPFSKKKISTMQQLINFMIMVELPSTGWYTSAVSLEPLPGIELPPNSRVEIKKNNNSSFVITVSIANAYLRSYFYNGTNVYPLDPSGSKICLQEKTSARQNTGRLVGLNINDNDSDVSILQYTSTEANNLVTLGGGTSTMGTCTRARVQLGKTKEEKTGDVVLEVTTDGLFSGEQDKYFNGTAGRRWKETYSVKYMFTPTVGQFYGLGSPEDVVTAGVGSTYQ